MVATRRSKQQKRPASKQADEAPPQTSKPSRSKKAKTGVAVGDDCPDFTLENEESKEVTLKELIKENPIIIFMYPKANTPGCTKQACGFRDNYADIVAAGYEVYGLSADKPQAQNSWKTKQDYQYHFLCDVEYAFMKALGVVKDGRRITRSHIIVGTDGKLLQVTIGVSPADSVDQATKYAKEHPQSKADEAEDKADKPEAAACEGEDVKEVEKPDEQQDVEMKDSKDDEKEGGKAAQEGGEAKADKEEDAIANENDQQENEPNKYVAEKPTVAELAKEEAKKDEEWVMVDKPDGAARNAAPEKEVEEPADPAEEAAAPKADAVEPKPAEAEPEPAEPEAAAKPAAAEQPAVAEPEPAEAVGKEDDNDGALDDDAQGPFQPQENGAAKADEAKEVAPEAAADEAAKAPPAEAKDTPPEAKAAAPEVKEVATEPKEAAPAAEPAPAAGGVPTVEAAPAAEATPAAETTPAAEAAPAAEPAPAVEAAPAVQAAPAMEAAPAVEAAAGAQEAS